LIFFGEAGLRRAVRRGAFEKGAESMKAVITIMAMLLAASLWGLSHAEDNLEKNREVIRRQHEKLNRGDWKAAVEDFAEDTRNHGRPVGRQGVRRVLEDIYTTFPDCRFEIAEMVAEGDSVVVRCTMSGTHRGTGKLPVNGGMLAGVAPTQKHFEVQHIHWYKLHDGKIVDHRANRDDIGMMQQLGLLPKVASPDLKR
jgi:steroid delta-isomerase-like uncharacterized protein